MRVKYGANVTVQQPPTPAAIHSVEGGSVADEIVKN